MRTSKNIALAALIAGLSPFAAVAQQVDLASMQASLTGLERDVDIILDRHGFRDVDPTDLSLSAIVEIIAAERDDEGGGASRSEIELALTRWRPPSN